MTLNEYQQAAMRTASGMNYEQYGAIMNVALGICGEGGEVADLPLSRGTTWTESTWRKS